MKTLLQTLYSIFAIYKYSTSKKILKIFNSETIKQLESNEFLNKLENSTNYVYIDLRTPLEYKISHHPKAININYLWHFKKKVSKIDKTKTIFINCLSAHRSPYAVFQLKKLGFTKIYDLKGGFLTITKNVNQ